MVLIKMIVTIASSKVTDDLDINEKQENKTSSSVRTLNN